MARNKSIISRWGVILILCLICISCRRPVEQAVGPAEPYKFLGLADDENSSEGPVGLIGGEAIQVSNVSKVQEAPYPDYLRAKMESKILAEEQHDGFVYWAVKEERDVHFENATAWVTVLERIKSRIE
jgi:hypothetical protein